MQFTFTRKQVQDEIAKMQYTPFERERIVEGMDLSDVARCLSSRMEDYAHEWLKEEVDRFLYGDEEADTMHDSANAINS